MNKGFSSAFYSAWILARRIYGSDSLEAYAARHANFVVNGPEWDVEPADFEELESEPAEVV